MQHIPVKTIQAQLSNDFVSNPEVPKCGWLGGWGIVSAIWVFTQVCFLCRRRGAGVGGSGGINRGGDTNARQSPNTLDKWKVETIGHRFGHQSDLDESSRPKSTILQCGIACHAYFVFSETGKNNTYSSIFTRNGPFWKRHGVSPTEKRSWQAWNAIGGAGVSNTTDPYRNVIKTYNV